MTMADDPRDGATLDLMALSADGGERFETILDVLHEGLLVLGPGGDLQRINASARAWMGPSLVAALSDPERWLDHLDLGPVEGLDASPRQLIGELLDGRPITDLHLTVTGTTRTRTLRINGRPLPASAGGGAVLTVLDVSEEMASQHQLRREARRDPLTDLPNRRAFDEAVREAGSSDVVMWLDCDRFKPINDRYGHHVGDIVLLTLGARLRVGVRAGDIAARVGGDEFAVLARRVSDEEVEALEHRLRTIVEQPIEAEGVLIDVGASIGTTRVRPGEHPSETMRRADEAMYRDKRARAGAVAGDRPCEDRSPGGEPA